MAVKMRTRTEYDTAMLEEKRRIEGKTFDRKHVLVSRAAFAGLGILLEVVGVIFWVGLQLELFGPILFVIGLALVGVSMFFYSFTAWFTFRAMGKRLYYNEFVLEDDAVRAIANEKEQSYLYADCTRLVETERCIYFFNNSSYLILDKNNVIGGKAEDMCSWMERKTGKSLEWMGRKKKH